ncbi:variable surface protein [Plasmodium gonderi]|uniref:Variable surface protein n=1 Tax=Plasmodium gonderi TaxID=77519 RepID=A0A1Y1JK62_PLAGO|nr:variable surface protein [Plasmodium gonderi]GAW80803.1 variable surface protein [Plasmodium gonderi]
MEAKYDLEDYPLVTEFAKYKQYIDGSLIHNTPHTNKYNCKNLHYHNIKKYENEIKEQCENIMFFLGKIHNDKTNKYFVIPALKYFYYWIYEKILDFKDIDKVETIYYRLYSEFKRFRKEQDIPDINAGIMTQKRLEDITLLYKMYKCFNDLNDRQETDEEKQFCEVLNIFINNNKPEKQEYPMHYWYAAQKGSSCPPEKPCKCVISRPVIVAFFVSIIMSLFLFYVLKYTSYGSKLIAREKNKRYNRDYIYKEEWDTSETPEMYYSTSEAPEMYYSTSEAPEMYYSTSEAPEMYDSTSEAPEMYYSTYETPEMFYNTYDDFRGRIIYNSY